MRRLIVLMTVFAALGTALGASDADGASSSWPTASPETAPLQSWSPSPSPAPAHAARPDTSEPALPDTLYAQSGADGTTGVSDSSFFRTPLAMSEVVVTATRNAKALERVAVPTSVIGAADIQHQGAVRLSDVLAQQPGLQVGNDHGSGVRIQGFDADYTLILIDGQPIIGRTAGTLNLDRIFVSGVKRVEVVRGPSSSLYGSEALAGVVNVITEDAHAPFEGTVEARYGTHQTSTLAARIAGHEGPVRVSGFISRYGTEGYDLSPTTQTPTVPSFSNYVGRTEVVYEAGQSTEVRLRGRASREVQTSTVTVTGEEGTFDNDAERVDWSLTPHLTHRFRPGLKLEAWLMGSSYRTQTELVRDSSGTVFDSEAYLQRHGRAEAKLQAALGTSHVLTVGGGFVAESVDADRLTGERTGGFAYVQDEWAATSRLDLVPSVRLDAHSDYATRVSPKLAGLYRPVDGLRLRASVGSGYKAPAFRQLYLSFTNAQAGYSVFGSQNVQEDLAELQRRGQIDALLTRTDGLGGSLEAERSVAFNAGAGVDLPSNLTLRLNLFHNEVRELIDTQPIARKTNGQQVFTYFNRGSVFTQGVEAEATWAVLAPLRLSLGYTYLQAKDRDVLGALEAGRIYRRTDAGRDVRVPPADYAGLPGRSRHRGTARLTYRSDAWGLTVDARTRLRGRYGFADRDGNGIIDAANEYAPGYAVADLTLTKTLFDDHTVQIGCNNLTGHTAPQYVTSLPGRTWFVSLRAKF